VTQLYPLALGFLFIISYVSLGYGGGILTRLHRVIFSEREREREREREGEGSWGGAGGSSERDYNGGVKDTIFSVLKFPRQCPLVLVVGVRLVFRINSKF
jgi:hypothetical protein